VVTLVGWSAPADAPDAQDALTGMAEVIAAALASFARVTFLFTFEGALVRHWTERGADFWCAVPRTDWREWASVAVDRLRPPTRLAAISTRRASTIADAFDTGAAPWCMQGQILLLSDPAASLPVLHRREWGALCSDEWALRTARLSAQGVIGAMRPGVDGDLAGLFAPHAAGAARALEAFAEAAAAANVSWDIVRDEDAFKARLAVGPSSPTTRTFATRS
jgi:hypothetical protein